MLPVRACLAQRRLLILKPALHRRQRLEVTSQRFVAWGTGAPLTHVHEPAPGVNLRLSGRKRSSGQSARPEVPRKSPFYENARISGAVVKSLTLKVMHKKPAAREGKTLLLRLILVVGCYFFTGCYCILVLKQPLLNAASSSAVNPVTSRHSCAGRPRTAR